MAITDLIPWKKDETSVPVRRGQGEETFLDLRKQMNRLFDEFFERPFGLSPFFGDSTLWGDFAPHMDVSETDKEIIISAELPGAEPEDIHITLDRNILTISGEKRAEKEEGGKRFYRVERSYGSFRRSILLPEGVDEDQIDASYKRGVLKVNLPKTARAQKKRKRITIKTD
jgi:HSP20 family protein